jgi:hypothetical protein
MARQRRGGFRPPELRGTLGTLLRTTLAQAGVVRDALERGAREGRSRLDDALSSRRRSDALAELGEIVLDLIRRGEIDIDELPEVRDLVEHLDSLDAGHPDEPEPAQAAPRRRFDARGRDDVVTEAPPTRRRAEPRGGDNDDGTVSSKAWAPKRAAGTARVWRPPVDVEIVPAPVVDDDVEPPPAAAKKPPRKGGISFGNNDDDDSDLAEYMHPDDVPPKAK